MSEPKRGIVGSGRFNTFPEPTQGYRATVLTTVIMTVSCVVLVKLSSQLSRL